MKDIDFVSQLAEEIIWSKDTTVELVENRWQRVYAKRPRSVAEFLIDARRWSERIHAVQGGIRLTFADHEKAVALVADWMRRNGVGQGTPIAFLARNRLECTIAFWAAHCLGAVVVLCNPWWSENEVKLALELSTPVMVLCDEETIRHLPDEINGKSVEGFSSFLNVSEAPPLPQPEITEDSPAMVIFTSGTEGTPKGVILSQRSVIVNMQNLLVATNRLSSHLDPEKPQSVTLLTVPLFHLAGIQVVIASLHSGARLVYQAGRFDAAEVLRLIEEEKVTTWGAVPAMVTRVMNHRDFGSRQLSTLRSIQVGGSAATAGFHQQVRESFPMLKIGGAGSLYGLTEAGGLLAMATASELSKRQGSVGQLLPVVRVKIDNPDSDGNGEILVQSPGLMSGFLGDGRSPIDEDGWLHTGDLGHVSDDKFLYLSGRLKEIIIRGGENISCSHVEQVLMSYPGVSEVVVVGLPHSELGEQVGAVIVPMLDAEVSVEQLKEYVLDKLGRFETPTRWWIRNLPLPTNASGKVVRRHVQRLWQEHGDIDIVE